MANDDDSSLDTELACPLGDGEVRSGGAFSPASATPAIAPAAITAAPSAATRFDGNPMSKNLIMRSNTPSPTEPDRSDCRSTRFAGPTRLRLRGSALSQRCLAYR